jgi:hypothetical protein
VEAMVRLDQEARQKLEAIELVADAMIGKALCVGDNTKKLEVELGTLFNSAVDFLNGMTGTGESIMNQARQALSIGLPNGKPSRKPFHWPLEFPEVFVRDNCGFDSIVGNPPFMGGKKISGSLGTHYRTLLVSHIADGKKGNADLCAYFFLRGCSILGKQGCYGLIATSSMAEGETREIGLDNMQKHNVSIYKANSSKPWLGSASVTYASIWITKIPWNGMYILNDKPVKGITAFLKEVGDISGKPYKLVENSSIAFIGSFIYGQGFVLTSEDAKAIIEKNQANKEVLFPYLIGQDFNTSPDYSPSAWVINFGNLSLKEAEKYVESMKIVRDKVKPEREKLKDKGYREKWWQFGRRAVALYERIPSLERVLFHSFTSKYTAFAFVPTGIIYGAPHVVIAFDGYEHFALLQSTIHECWVREYTSYSLSLARYTPSDCFETFPQPKSLIHLESIGEHYYIHRQSIMHSNQEGLTALYNRFHNPNDMDKNVQILRDLHVRLDNAAIKSYGWSNIDLSHGFYETKDGLRYTISEAARSEVLQRLLKLNHERYQEEVKQGFHNKKKTSLNGCGMKATDNDYPTLFEGESV